MPEKIMKIWVDHDPGDQHDIVSRLEAAKGDQLDKISSYIGGPERFVEPDQQFRNRITEALNKCR